MKKSMIVTALLILTAHAACWITYYFLRYEVLFSLIVTSGTCFYHIAMRLIVGHGIDAIFKNKMNYNRWWFKERKFERKFYNFLRVKKWKKHLPTYNPEYYDVRKHTVEEIIQVTCQAEIVHEINMVLSFVPVIFILWFGSPVAFIVTSSLAFCFDGLFVIMQRYNRPRLRRLLKR